AEDCSLGWALGDDSQSPAAVGGGWGGGVGAGLIPSRSDGVPPPSAAGFSPPSPPDFGGSTPIGKSIKSRVSPSILTNHPSFSQSPSTTLSPAPWRWTPGRWVWPWISTRAPRAASWRSTSAGVTSMMLAGLLLLAARLLARQSAAIFRRRLRGRWASS